VCNEVSGMNISYRGIKQLQYTIQGNITKLVSYAYTNIITYGKTRDNHNREGNIQTNIKSIWKMRISQYIENERDDSNIKLVHVWLQGQSNKGKVRLNEVSQLINTS